MTSEPRGAADRDGHEMLDGVRGGPGTTGTGTGIEMTKRHTGPRREDEPCEFRVVGARRDDPGHLLVMGCDGRWYDYDIAANHMTPVELTDSWAVDVSALPVPSVTAPLGKLVS